jgi:inorganic pyrophosphatase
MTYDRIRNDRVIALPIETRREAAWQTLDDIPERVCQEWIQFTIASGALDGKDATAVGWGGRDEALSLIRSAVEKESTHVGSRLSISIRRRRGIVSEGGVQRRD